MKRILIVEDDMALAQELQYLLISNQYDAQCVEEFTDVAGQILASQADMVLLDINLPEVDGQSVLRELRKTSDIPVIMVTSKNTEMDEVISMSFGADDFIAISYLWDSEAFVDDNTLTVNMNRVRKKLADLGVEDIIRTKRGQGYILA